MSNIRIIQYSSENGAKEGVVFTTDHDTDASEFIPFGHTLDADAKTDIDESEFPGAFPFDYHLKRD